MKEYARAVVVAAVIDTVLFAVKVVALGYAIHLVIH
jgi:hypothetical protein